MRIYTDLDNVLINPVLDPITESVVEIVPRPDVTWFLDSLSKEGELWVLTAAADCHADKALAMLDPEGRYVSGIISAPDLYEVSRQVDVILNAQGLTDQERATLTSQIPPVGPPGVMFDDFPVWSAMYWLKASAIGIGPERWIEVDPFTDELPDQGGLRKAYEEFAMKFLGKSEMKGSWV